jgi:hypothetical protein
VINRSIRNSRTGQQISAWSSIVLLCCSLLLAGSPVSAATQSSGYGEWEVWQSQHGGKLRSCYMRTRSKSAGRSEWLTIQGQNQHDIANTVSLGPIEPPLPATLVREVEYQIDDQPRQPAWASIGSNGEIQLTLPPLMMRRGTDLHIYLPGDEERRERQNSFSLMGFSAGWRHVNRCSRVGSGDAIATTPPTTTDAGSSSDRPTRP